MGTILSFSRDHIFFARIDRMSPLLHSLRITLLLSLLLIQPFRVQAFDGEDMLDMMRLMNGMMNMWDLFSSLSEFSGNHRLTSDPWLVATPGSSYPLAGRPWDPYSEGMGLSPLDGVWQGSNGVRLTLRGNRFSLFQRGSRPLYGNFMVTNQRFIAYVANTDSSLQFYFEYRHGMFILQDASGQLILFKKSPG